MEYAIQGDGDHFGVGRPRRYCYQPLRLRCDALYSIRFQAQEPKKRRFPALADAGRRNILLVGRKVHIGESAGWSNQLQTVAAAVIPGELPGDGRQSLPIDKHSVIRNSETGCAAFPIGFAHVLSYTYRFGLQLERLHVQPLCIQNSLHGIEKVVWGSEHRAPSAFRHQGASVPLPWLLRVDGVLCAILMDREKEDAPVGKKNRPCMARFLRCRIDGSDGLSLAAGCRHFHQRTTIAGEDDGAVAAPCGALSDHANVAEGPGNASRERDSLQLAVGKKSNGGAVRRPEGPARAFGLLQFAQRQRAQIAKTKKLLARLPVESDGHYRAAIRRRNGFRGGGWYRARGNGKSESRGRGIGTCRTEIGSESSGCEDRQQDGA